MSDGLIVGVDVGGTFTDLFLFDDCGANASAPPRCRRAAATRRRASSTACGARRRRGALGSIVHGTTVGTNALLERRGPKIGVITTRGFRDVLEMRRRDRRRTWGLWGDFVPIVERDLRLEVDERTLADGTVRTAVDRRPGARAPRSSCSRSGRAGARDHLHQCLRQSGQRAPARSPPRARSGRTSTSPPRTRCSPEIREFERASTTALNAYLQPVVGSYLGNARDGARPAADSPAGSTSCSRTAASCRPRPRAGCRSAPRCRARRPASSPARRSRGRPASTTSSPATSAARRSTCR